MRGARVAVHVKRSVGHRRVHRWRGSVRSRVAVFHVERFAGDRRVARCCHSSASSTGVLHRSCGMMPLARPMTSPKGRAVNKVILACPRCTHWGNMALWKRSRWQGTSPVMPAFGQTAFGQNRIWPELVFQSVLPNVCVFKILGVFKIVCVCVVCVVLGVFNCVCCVCCACCVCCVRCVCCVCVFKIFGGCLQDFGWVSSRFLGLSAGPSPPPPERPSAGPPPPRGRPAFFFPSRHNFHSFFSLWGVFSLNFGGV